MTSHRAQPPRRRAAPPAGRRRAERPQPRYGRLAVLGASVSVTGIAMLGGVGVLPSVANGGSGGDGDTARDTTAEGSVLAGAATTPSAQTVHGAVRRCVPQGRRRAGKVKNQPAVTSTSDAPQDDDRTRPSQTTPATAGGSSSTRATSGSGWSTTTRTSSGPTWSRAASTTTSTRAPTRSTRGPSTPWGIDDSGTMEYFVRFTEGTNGAAIGFHDIPIDDGELVQTVAELGTPQSHGCIRQERDDAIALWEFAPIGTEVDVTA